MTAFYITTAIEYANGEPHLGHAFEKIGADAIARYHRLRGETVHLLAGTDDHGLKVARAAQAAGRSPRAQADHISAIFQATWDTLGIGYDTFVRTTEPHHAAGVTHLIHRIIDRHPDAFYEKAYDGWYCVGCEAFRTERDLDHGRCPLHPTLEVERVSRIQLVLPAQRVRGVPPLTPACPSGLHPAGQSLQRDRRVRGARARGCVDHPRVARLGHPVSHRVARRPSPGDLRLVRRAAQLSHGHRLSRHGRRDCVAGAGPRRRARTSRAFTACSGLRCSTPPDCPCRSASGPTGS